MGSPRRLTESSSCTFVASRAIDHFNGCSGSHGRSSSSIRRTKAHFRTPRSGWSTGANHQPSGPMSRGTRVAAVAKNMEERQEFLADIRARLEQAQTVQKHHYDKAHRDVSYKVDDWVLLRLRQCRWRRCPRPPSASSSHAGKMSSHSTPDIQHSSSKTSCLSRRGEMSCLGVTTIGTLGVVGHGMCDAQRNARRTQRAEVTTSG
jgi:hypothetical protein